MTDAGPVSGHSREGCQSQATPFRINLPVQIMLSFRTLEVQTRIVTLYGDNRTSRNAREPVKGEHVVAFPDREDF
jgi:hypothetical protein